MQSKRAPSLPSAQYWALVIFLTVLFATGGSSRIDVPSLIVLRPLSVIFCAFACLTLRREHLTGRRWLLGTAASVFAVALLHLAPLPPTLWHSLAGRQGLVALEKLADLSDSWRPLTLTPVNAWQAVGSLLVPFAIILLGIQLHRDDLFRLLPLIIALATLSGLIGLLQVVGDPQGSLYLYEITNSGTAVGLFANRNHAATLLACLFPMLAAFASKTESEVAAARMRQLASVVIAIVLVPLLLITGSRSGLVSAILGLAAATLLYRQRPRLDDSRRGWSDRINVLPFAVVGALVILGLLTYFVSRAEAIERLFGEAEGVGRNDFWAVSVNLIWKYFPWGSGSGSFGQAYQYAEPVGLVGANYLNRAHNDWIETALTFGLAGAIALVVAVIAFGIRSHYLWHNSNSGKRLDIYRRLASVMIALIAIASLSDYPLRTPIMMGLFAVLVLWLTETNRDQLLLKTVAHSEA